MVLSGKWSVLLLGNLKPYQVVEMVITKEFLDNCITATNAHGEKNEKFTKIFAQGISDSEKVWAI